MALESSTSHNLSLTILSLLIIVHIFIFYRLCPDARWPCGRVQALVEEAISPVCEWTKDFRVIRLPSFFSSSSTYFSNTHTHTCTHSFTPVYNYTHTNTLLVGGTVQAQRPPCRVVVLAMDDQSGIERIVSWLKVDRRKTKVPPLQDRIPGSNCSVMYVNYCLVLWWIWWFRIG